jgi:hypothetical protein
MGVNSEGPRLPALRDYGSRRDHIGYLERSLADKPSTLLWLDDQIAAMLPGPEKHASLIKGMKRDIADQKTPVALRSRNRTNKAS